MNQDGTVINIGVLLFREANRMDKTISRSIAIAVTENLPAIRESLLNGLVGGLLIDGGITPVVFGLPLGHNEVGFGQPGGLALR